MVAATETRPQLSCDILELKSLTDSVLKTYDYFYFGDGSCLKRPGNLSALTSGAKNISDFKFALDRVGDLNRVILSLPCEPRDYELNLTAEIIQTADESGISRFLVNNYGVLNLVNRLCPEARITAGPFLNVYTGLTAHLISEYQVDLINFNPEVSFNEILKIINESTTSIKAEIQLHGPIPLGCSDSCYLISQLDQHDQNQQQGQESEPDCWKLCTSPAILERMDWTLRNAGFLTLSGRDLCALPLLKQITATGLINNFRIYTAFSSPDYIEKIGLIYRQALDNQFDAEFISKSLKTMEQFNPDGLCNGFLAGCSGSDFVNQL